VNDSVKSLVLSVLLAGGLAAGPVQADAGAFLMRLRAVQLDFAQKSDAIPALGVPADAIRVDNQTIPDIDFEYFFTKSFSTELVLTYPQSQTVTVQQSALGGPVDIGTFKYLPPTLTAKWNFLPDGTIRPYVGIGVNLTLITNVDLNNVQALNDITGTISLDSSSVGLAGQAGVDFKVADHYFINADIKYMKLQSDVKTANFGKVSSVNLDPWLFGIGIGYRF
jgi:outer membrane protein